MRSFLSHPNIFNPPPGHSVVEDRHGELHLVEDRELLEAAREVARDLRIKREVGLSVGEIAEIVGRVAREETMFRFNPAYTFPRSKSAPAYVRRKQAAGVVVKTFRAVTRAAGDGKVEAVISTGSIDRDGERVLPSAFERRLGSFMKYPVLLSGHEYRGGLLKVIGRVEKISIGDSGVTAKLRYLIDQGNQEADWGFMLAAKEGLASYSIGFLPWDWREETREGEPRRVFTDIEILEVSHVVIPSQRDALVSAR